MKKMIAGLVLAAILLLSTAVTGMAADNKPDNVQSDIQKITFVHYAKSADNSKSPLYNGQKVLDYGIDSFQFLLPSKKITWKDTAHYKINILSSELLETELDSDAVYSAIGASLETWDCETSFHLFDLDETASSFVPGVQDFNNTIGWGSFTNPDIIAQNTVWYSMKTATIVESDVQFSTGYKWSTDSSCPTDAMDLQNIATHEFGHNGLGDLYYDECDELTMYGYSTEGDIIKRDLATGDISGIRALYDMVEEE